MEIQRLLDDGCTTSNSSQVEGQTEQTPTRSGMSMWMTSFFLVAQMAGAGFLALPRAFADSGWIGVPLLIVFCVSIAFSGTRLGHCWVILEERWPQYQQPARQPYMDIAERAFGKAGRNLAMVAVLVTLIGSSIVYIILIAEFLRSLFEHLSTCTLVVIIGVGLIPFTWPGTPKDFWPASVLAVVATFTACVVIFVQLMMDKDSFPEPEFRDPTFKSFSLGFGTILFSFGGASVFPTIQNDMQDRAQFWKSVAVAFAVLLVMYLPVAVTGFALLGFDVPSNILLYAGNELTLIVKIAVVFQGINLIATYLIAFNPVCQIFEDVLDMPRDFSWKRIALRTSISVIELIIALAFPDFGLLLNLVGGSTVTLCSFVLPPLMYMSLVRDKSSLGYPTRTLPLWESVILWEIVIVGIIGGLSSTVSAILGIINAPELRRRKIVGKKYVEE